MNQNNMSETERRILKWDDPDDGSDTCDLIHKHFTECSGKFETWSDVADEGLRLWNMMFSDNIEEGSPTDGVLTGIAAAGYELAIAHVASQLGVSGYAVECALEHSNVGNPSAFLGECQRANKNQSQPDRNH